MKNFLLADGGGSKTTWHYFNGTKGKTFVTAGIAPYLITTNALNHIVDSVYKKLNTTQQPTHIYYYGTGCANITNANKVKASLKKYYTKAKIAISNDLDAVAKATCQHHKGIACILGTGSNSGVYNGKKITKNSPGTGYILGDEGSGAFLGKLVLQYYLYNVFDAQLMQNFNDTYKTNRNEIYEKTYRQPLANKYLASFAPFLLANKGHYMIDNIILDGIALFMSTHLLRYPESNKYPIHFSGGIAYNFAPYLHELCANFGFTIGTIINEPIKGLITYHKNN